MNEKRLASSLNLSFLKIVFIFSMLLSQFQSRKMNVNSIRRRIQQMNNVLSSSWNLENTRFAQAELNQKKLGFRRRILEGAHRRRPRILGKQHTMVMDDDSNQVPESKSKKAKQPSQKDQSSVISSDSQVSKKDSAKSKKTGEQSSVISSDSKVSAKKSAKKSKKTGEQSSVISSDSKVSAKNSAKKSKKTGEQSSVISSDSQVSKGSKKNSKASDDTVELSKSNVSGVASKKSGSKKSDDTVDLSGSNEIEVQEERADPKGMGVIKASKTSKSDDTVVLSQSAQTDKGDNTVELSEGSKSDKTVELSEGSKSDKTVELSEGSKSDKTVELSKSNSSNEEQQEELAALDTKLSRPAFNRIIVDLVKSMITSWYGELQFINEEDPEKGVTVMENGREVMKYYISEDLDENIKQNMLTIEMVNEVYTNILRLQVLKRINQELKEYIHDFLNGFLMKSSQIAIKADDIQGEMGMMISHLYGVPDEDGKSASEEQESQTQKSSQASEQSDSKKILDAGSQKIEAASERRRLKIRKKLRNRKLKQVWGDGRKRNRIRKLAGSSKLNDGSQIKPTRVQNTENSPKTSKKSETSGQKSTKTPEVRSNVSQNTPDSKKIALSQKTVKSQDQVLSQKSVKTVKSRESREQTPEASRKSGQSVKQLSKKSDDTVELSQSENSQAKVSKKTGEEQLSQKSGSQVLVDQESMDSEQKKTLSGSKMVTGSQVSEEEQSLKIEDVDQDRSQQTNEGELLENLSMVDSEEEKPRRRFIIDTESGEEINLNDFYTQEELDSPIIKVRYFGNFINSNGEISAKFITNDSNFDVITMEFMKRGMEFELVFYNSYFMLTTKFNIPTKRFILKSFEQQMEQINYRLTNVRKINHMMIKDSGDMILNFEYPKLMFRKCVWMLFGYYLTFTAVGNKTMDDLIWVTESPTDSFIVFRFKDAPKLGQKPKDLLILTLKKDAENEIETITLKVEIFIIDEMKDFAEKTYPNESMFNMFAMLESLMYESLAMVKHLHYLSISDMIQPFATPSRTTTDGEFNEIEAMNIDLWPTQDIQPSYDPTLKRQFVIGPARKTSFGWSDKIVHEGKFGFNYEFTGQKRLESVETFDFYMYSTLIPGSGGEGGDSEENSEVSGEGSQEQSQKSQVIERRRRKLWRRPNWEKSKWEKPHTSRNRIILD